jgi:hypothetical protein
VFVTVRFDTRRPESSRQRRVLNHGWTRINTDDNQERRGRYETNSKNPEGISSISPALTDEIRLRRVADYELKTTPKELNQNVAIRCNRVAVENGFGR